MSQYRIHHAHKQTHTLKDFVPLIGIVAIVLVATGLTMYYTPLDWMLAFMGWFFVVFGGLKLIRLKDFVGAYKEYDLLAAKSTTYGYVYPFLEFGFGLAYLFAWQVVAVSWVVLIVMLIGAAGVYRKLRKKEEVPCACLGTVFQIPMTWVTLAEDLLMAGMAAMIIFPL